MKPLLQFKVSHQLMMTPQLQQAIGLLQLSTLELKTKIEEALEKNSMLELMEAPPQTDPFNETTEITCTIRQEPIEEIATHPWENWGAKMNSREEEIASHPLESNDRPETLKEYLLWQMQLTPFNETERFIATALIDAINEDGFLIAPLEEIMSMLMASDITEKLSSKDLDEIEIVLHRIQQFDPPGVGARNLSECLSLQLQHLPQFPWREKAQQLVCHHLDLLAKHHYAALRRHLGLDDPTLRQVIQLIQSLNPRPGAKIGVGAPSYVEPDVFVSKKQGDWVVELNPACTPALQINQHYAQLIRRADESADNQFLRQQFQEARWFLKSIETRNDTLLKVTQCIVAQQKDFLEYGEEAMKPLILQDVAQALGMHESTISRVTTHKYLYTPRGTFELKYFFSSRLTNHEGKECSATAIRALIKKLIATENPHKPLSDNKLEKLLSLKGFQVARRTVAKYREALEIPPSNERKELL